MEGKAPKRLLYTQRARRDPTPRPRRRLRPFSPSPQRCRRLVLQLEGSKPVGIARAISATVRQADRAATLRVEGRRSGEVSPGELS